MSGYNDGMIQTLTTRQLNRTFLQRQFLLERSELPTASVISRLIALQSQAANSPYEALWSRINGFQPSDLDALYASKDVLRATWFRSTVHSVLSKDFQKYRNVHSEVFLRGVDTYIPGLKLTDKLDELKDSFADADLLTGREMATIADGLMPGQDWEIWNTARFRRAIPLVRHPNGVNGRTKGPRDPWAEAESYIGETLQPNSKAAVEELVIRYLEGFGPASVADASNFLGLTRLAPIFRSLALVEYKAEDGTLLYDTPEGVLADADIDAPARLMASFDHSILGHADRSRIIDPGYGKILSGANAVFKPYILLDGMVAGYWSYAVSEFGPEVKLCFFEDPSEEQVLALSEEARSWCECWFGVSQGLRVFSILDSVSGNQRGVKVYRPTAH